MSLPLHWMLLDSRICHILTYKDTQKKGLSAVLQETARIINVFEVEYFVGRIYTVTNIYLKNIHKMIF